MALWDDANGGNWPRSGKDPSPPNAVLDALDDEVRRQYASLKDPTPFQETEGHGTLARTSLPIRQARQGQELLGMLGALGARLASSESECEQLLEALRVLEGAYRRAEFGRARAEALATARGEALMRAQNATREAENQQLQLSDMLRQVLSQLGVAVSPSSAATPGSVQSWDRSVPDGDARPVRAQKLFHSPAAAAARASRPASPSRETSIAQASLSFPVSGRDPLDGSLPPSPLPLSERAAASREVEASLAQSGFTIFTNSMPDHGPGPDKGRAPAAAPAARARGAGPAPALVQPAGVGWKDIAAAVRASSDLAGSQKVPRLRLPLPPSPRARGGETGASSTVRMGESGGRWEEGRGGGLGSAAEEAGGQPGTRAFARALLEPVHVEEGHESLPLGTFLSPAPLAAGGGGQPGAAVDRPDKRRGRGAVEAVFGERRDEAFYHPFSAHLPAQEGETAAGKKGKGESAGFGRSVAGPRAVLAARNRRD